MYVVSDLLSFIAQSPSAFHVVKASEDMLHSAGFLPLMWGKPWQLERGKCYYVKVFGSAMFAFRVGKSGRGKRGIRMAAAHTDFPGFRVKPIASMKEDGYGLLNVEPYGGLILSSFLDRPMSLAGEIVLRGEDAFHPDVYLVDIARPLMIIPRLAIHMNRDVNTKGEKLNRQTDLAPIAALLDENCGEDYFRAKLAREIDRKPEEILSYDLTAYPVAAGCTLGFDGEMIASPRLDNLASVRAALDGLIDSNNASGDGIDVVALFDNEEIGSRTKAGASSGLARELLEAIYRALSLDADDLAEDIARGFLISVDAAHALHPSHAEKADPTNRPRLGRGFVIKEAASGAYVGDATSAAVVRSIADDAKIPYQYFANRNDIPGGATLGSMLSASLVMRGQDIGVPILSMHSARETMAAADQESLTRFITSFFASEEKKKDRPKAKK